MRALPPSPSQIGVATDCTSLGAPKVFDLFGADAVCDMIFGAMGFGAM